MASSQTRPLGQQILIGFGILHAIIGVSMILIGVSFALLELINPGLVFLYVWCALCASLLPEAH
jgi:hypothetical protein